MLKNIDQLFGLILLVSLGCLTQAKPPEVVLYEGDACVTHNYEGICSVEKQCPHLEATMTRKGLLARNVGRCGYTVYEEIICCPSNNPERPLHKLYHSVIRESITLIITSTTVIQSEKIGDDLIFTPLHVKLA